MASNKVVHPAIDGIQIPMAIGGFQIWVLFGYGDDFTFNLYDYSRGISGQLLEMLCDCVKVFARF